MIDKLGFGISLAVVGIGTVFLILFLLQMVMKGEAWLFTARNLRTTNKAGEPSEPLAGTSEEVSGPNLSPQVVAAILGAISCQTGRPARNFRLVSVRQASDRKAAAAWNSQGRTDLINTRSSFYTKGGTN